MKSKSIWMTIIVSVAVSFITSMLTVNLASPQLAPSYGALNQSNLTLRLPDLIVESFYEIGRGCGGGNNITCSIELGAVIKNVGQTGAQASRTNIELEGRNYNYYSSKKVFTPALQPGQTTLVRALFQNVTLRYWHAGYATADWFNAVHESNENNNFRNITIAP